MQVLVGVALWGLAIGLAPHTLGAFGAASAAGGAVVAIFLQHAKRATIKLDLQRKLKGPARPLRMAA